MRTLTSEYFFPDVRKEFHVDYGCDDTFQSTELGVDAEREKHEEKEDRPERSPGKLINSFRECDES